MIDVILWGFGIALMMDIIYNLVAEIVMGMKEPNPVILLKVKALYFVGLIAGLFINWKVALSAMIWISIIATAEYMIRRREYVRALMKEAKEKIEEQ